MGISGSVLSSFTVVPDLLETTVSSSTSGLAECEISLEK